MVTDEIISHYFELKKNIWIEYFFQLYINYFKYIFFIIIYILIMNNLVKKKNYLQLKYCK